MKGHKIIVTQYNKKNFNLSIKISPAKIKAVNVLFSEASFSYIR